ncbi:uncharacterized protein ARB_03594 [Trichophyton benhamiae CBS 112371]|uniref:Uncharacterized protein n=1 Tax=Arthroderma benhamiae (strain ATCC MYA-4681 / CBS 112371) TaxID=663331 RepID=D4B568_ARTBC|nr:uncharacterized protein ARB_03594 [Trichophyton benhamiae CBS 112371]EFE29516.1 hypothetical protein ARB_03594 [Trichophyton benhamiae CBS 112371]
MVRALNWAFPFDMSGDSHASGEGKSTNKNGGNKGKQNSPPPTRPTPTSTSRPALSKTTSTSPPTSTSTSALVRLWSSIPEADTVRINSVMGRETDPGVTARLRATSLYGCTAIVVVDELGMVLGHIAQEGKGNNIYTLESIPQVGEYLTTFVKHGGLVFDFGRETHAIIYYSRGKASFTGGRIDIGLNCIKNYLVTLGVQEANVHFSQYTSGGPTVGPRSKLVVESVYNNNARRTNVYIAKEDPIWQRDFTKPLRPARFNFQPGPPLPRLSHNDQVAFERHCDFAAG